MNFEKLINKYMKHGYNYDEAINKIAQDILLLKISKSKYFRNVTIKGGVAMHTLSKDLRRATKDMDIDFIKYSLSDSSIKKFISDLNNVQDNIHIEIKGNIKELRQQDYKGKKIYVLLKDNFDNEIETKIDIGVHKYLDLNQEKIFIDFNLMNEGAYILFNSPEQIFTEKIKSYLRIGLATTRYKDIFDLYYLITYEKLDKLKVLKYFNILIYENNNIDINNMNQLIENIKIIFNNSSFKTNLNIEDNNWLSINNNQVIRDVINYLETLNKIALPV